MARASAVRTRRALRRRDVPARVPLPRVQRGRVPPEGLHGVTSSPPPPTASLPTCSSRTRPSTPARISTTTTRRTRSRRFTLRNDGPGHRPARRAPQAPGDRSAGCRSTRNWFLAMKATLNVADSAAVRYVCRKMRALLPERLRTYRRGRVARARPAGWHLPEQHSGTRGYRGDPEGAGEGDGRVGRSGHRATGQQLSTLESPDARFAAGFREAFPSIPGVAPPSVMNTVDVAELGPDFGPQGGIEAWCRQSTAAATRRWCPGPMRTARHGRIKTMWTRAPIGRNVGWNVRAGFRAPDLAASRFVHSVCKDEGRAARERRLAQIARGALPEPRRLREGGHEGCKGARQGRFLSRRMQKHSSTRRKRATFSSNPANDGRGCVPRSPRGKERYPCWFAGLCWSCVVPVAVLGRIGRPGTSEPRDPDDLRRIMAHGRSAGRPRTR